VRTFAGKKRFLRYTYAHPVKSGGRQPAVVHETHLRGQFRAHPHTTVARSTRSGGRQLAVVRESHLQVGSICVRRITPPRAADVSPPWVCKPRLQLQCDEFRRFEFASAMHPTGAYAFGAFTWSPPRPMSSHAECIPRGAYAPRSCFAVRTSADKKTIFAIHIRTSGQERRASARRGSEIAPARTIPHTSAHDRRMQRQERRASARRGSRNALAGRFALRSANNATKSGGR
jgi:hypothetical protein